MILNQVHPETLKIPPTAHSPNSKFPVLAYRNALIDITLESALAAFEQSEWKKGGHWKIGKEKLAATPHYHAATHEAHTVLHGRATYFLGKSSLDPETDTKGDPVGLQFTVNVGDVFVFPAGVTHFVIDTENDYEILGFYSLVLDGATETVMLERKNSIDEPYDMEYALDSVEETDEKRKRCELVPVPVHDPIYGKEGPMIQIWNSV